MNLNIEGVWFIMSNKIKYKTKKRDEHSKKNENHLIDFLEDIHILDELESEIGFNTFETLSIVRAEIRHSNVLAWLLNPNESHNLKDYFIKEFIKSVYQNNKKTLSHLKPEDLYLWDFDNVEVFRERHRIDILVVDNDNKFLIIIENKIDSNEHGDQLSKYKNIVDREYPDFKKMFIYLTKTGEEASDSNIWGSYSYEVILNDLIGGCINKTNSKIRNFIEDYQDILRRYIVGDNRLEEMCRKIYYKHKKALDLIYEYKPDTTLEISKHLLDYVSSNEDIIEKHSIKTIVRFSDKILESINDKYRNVDSDTYWVRDNSIILYELKITDKYITLSTVVGPTRDGTRDEIINHFIEKGHKTNSSGKKWTSLKQTKIININQDDHIEAILDKIDDNLYSKLIKHRDFIGSIFKDYK